jgi:hypothetical protein
MPLSSGWPSSIFPSNLRSVVGFCIIIEELGFVSNGESSSSFNIIAYFFHFQSEINSAFFFFLFFKAQIVPFHFLIGWFQSKKKFRLNQSSYNRSLTNQPISGVLFGKSMVYHYNLSFGGMSLILVYANQIVPFHFIS